MSENLLEMRPLSPGVFEVALDLKVFYPDPAARYRFRIRCEEFIRAQGTYSTIFDLRHDKLTYHTEQLIPTRSDPRPSLLLLFGNPASHSVHAGMFFSFEGEGRQHRFWKVLASTGLLVLRENDLSSADLSVAARNQAMRHALLTAEYDSPFKLGFAVRFTIPSNASGSPWAGVAGLHRLFGREEMRRIGEWELERVERRVREFVTSDGAVLTFQKDAYSALKAVSSPEYSLQDAWAGRLIGTCRRCADTMLLCSPPTRYSNSKDFSKLLVAFRDHVLGGRQVQSDG